jgi:ATP-binding cassette subfamily B protein
LHDVSFSVEAGQTVALVGRSGGGKTTITHLIARLYDVSDGAVLVGGLDVRDLQLATLRNAVGYVTQDAHMFHDTIRANLVYARPGLGTHSWEALAAAQIKDLVEAPGRFDTVVGERGYRLSEGSDSASRSPGGSSRRRRIVVRRGNRTSGLRVRGRGPACLDTAMERSYERRHRPSAVHHPQRDMIIVVDRGRVVRGRHAELPPLWSLR